jgi:hypothetical protein
VVERGLNDVQATITYSDVEAVTNTIEPTIMLHFQVATRVRSANGSNIVVTNPILKVSVRLNHPPNTVIVGDAYSERLAHFWDLNSNNALDFTLKLDHHTLSQIEKLRGGAKLILGFRMRFLYHSSIDPTLREVEFDIENQEIPKSKWVEDILPPLKYKNVALVELPYLEHTELQSAIDKLNLAWHKFAMGDYDDVLVKCRAVIEEFASYVKKQGHEIERTNDNGSKGMVPDWKRFFGNEERGAIFGAIVQKVSGFVVRGAHSGSVIGRDEAYFAILQTMSLCSYVIATLKRQVQS